MGEMLKIYEASKSLLTGMRLTIKRVMMPEVTQCYPFQQPELGERFRGAPMLKGAMDESYRVETIPNELGVYNASIRSRAEQDKLPQCSHACPAHLDVRGYVELIAEGRYKESLDLIRERCSMPASIGRVCTRPCETGCQRNFFDQPISIRDLKRFAADACKHLPHPAPILKTKTKSVAIVGAGPTGLTAAQSLAKEGYPVTIFDKNPAGGGTLLTGIPKYRLPKDELKWDVDAVCALGVELKTNVEVGKDITLAEIIDSFDAVLIAAGLPAGWNLGIDGEEAEGVWGCLDLLREMNFDRDPRIGKRVAVVGGGNVAMDGARTSLRLGAEEVYLIYRRSMEEMPARHEEIHEALEEGVRFELLSNPTRVVVKNGKVVGIECVKMGLGEPDASGRRRPEPVAGSEYVLDVDTVVVAIGQKTDLKFLEGTDIELTERGAIAYDKLTLQTSNPKVFAAGEVVTGAGAAIEAMASGHEAADSLNRFLSGMDLTAGRVPQVPAKKYSYPKIDPQWIEADRRRAEMPMIPLRERAKGFMEVELGFSDAEALREANRCLVCKNGSCSGCEMCERACPVHCIDVTREAMPVSKNGDSPHGVPRMIVAWDFDFTKCMVCGLCAEVCPTNALKMSKDFENAEFTKERFYYDKERVLRHY